MFNYGFCLIFLINKCILCLKFIYVLVQSIAIEDMNTGYSVAIIKLQRSGQRSIAPGPLGQY